MEFISDDDGILRGYTWHIEIRDKWGNWQLNHVGEDFGHNTKREALDAVEGLREQGDEWVDAEYRVFKKLLEIRPEEYPLLPSGCVLGEK